MSGRRRTGLVLVAGAIVVAGVAAFQWLAKPAAMSAATPVVPVARITRGSMTLAVYLQGELRATKQVNLTAPPMGSVLRILTMVEPGTKVAKDEAVVEFDPADQQYALEQAESQLREAEQELIKRRAEIKAQDAQDKVSLLTAEFDVRRATLEARMDPDLIALNDYKIRQAELEEATRNFERLKRDVSARALTTTASLTVLEERKARSTMAATRARQNLDNMVLRAPMAGVVSVRDNMDGAMMFYTGMSLPAYRAGDTVSPGRPLMDVIDVSAMEVRATVNEQERANVAVGQPARVEADTAPGLALKARVAAVAGLGRADSRTGPLRQFDLTLELSDSDPRLMPGTTVRVLVQGGTVENVLLMPRQALFEIDGKPTVYVRTGGGDAFGPRQIKVLHRTETQVAVEGLGEGFEVALIDPVAALRLGGAAPGASKPTDVRK